MNNLIVTHSAAETEAFGFKFAQKLKGNELVALFGEMGAGKTVLTRGFSRCFGLENQVHSPTFSLVNEYSNGIQKIYHFDMYRIMTLEDLESTGFFEFLNNFIIICEWSENISEFLPANRIEIHLEKLPDELSRKIRIKNYCF